MYIIAIVLLTGVSFESVSAESLVDLPSSVSVEVENVVRNDTLDVDSAIQQNTEKNEEKISQSAKTGDALSFAVDALLLGTIGAGVDVSNENFCSALDSTLMKQADSVRASLAWNPTSYQKNINLKYQGEDGVTSSLHESTQNAFKNASDSLKNLTPRSDKAIDAVMLSRYQAIARSALVEMNMNLKAKDFDASNTNDSALLLQGSLNCIEKYVSDDESAREKFSSVKTTIGEVVAEWDANKNSFGVSGDAAVKEPFYLKISSKEITQEDKVTPENADDVVSKEDLALYVQAVMANDSSVKDVVIDDTSVSMKYATRAKLFGVIPVWLTPKTTVNTNGEVVVKYPWHSVLSSKKVKVSAENIKSDLIEQGLVSSVETQDVPSEMSMQYRAQLVDTLNMVIKSNLEIQADGEEGVIESEDAVIEGDTSEPVDSIEAVPQA